MERAVLDYRAEVHASADGDVEAFGRLVAAQQSSVCAVTYSMTGDLTLSEDLAQETFFIAWQRLGNLRDPERLPQWLRGIARNLAREALRKRQRDPVRGAVSLDAADSASGDLPQSSVAEDERLAVTWEALEALPIIYREPLVLFYREGRSIRSVAATLGISEDAVKQRLSRGRGLLRERVVVLVEETLTQTNPSQTFALAIIATLPVMGGQAAVLSSAIGAATKGAGTISKGATAAAGAGVLGGLVGAVAGMTGGFFGMWMSIRNASTLRVRRFMLQSSVLIYAFLWVFFGYQGLCGILFWDTPVNLAIACGVGWLMYLILLPVSIVVVNRRGRQLEREDREDAVEQSAPLEESAYSLRRLWQWFTVGMALAVAGSVVTVLWLESLPHVNGWWGVPWVVLSHYCFWRIFIKGVSISRDEVAFIETAPPLAVMNSQKVYKQPSRRALLLNDAGALGGSVLGSSAWLIISLLKDGQVVLGAGLLIGFLGLLGAAVWLISRWPERRHWVYFGTLLTTGFAIALILLCVPIAWLREEYIGHTFYWRLAAAGACLGLAAVLAIACLYICRSNTADPGDNAAD